MAAIRSAMPSMMVNFFWLQEKRFSSMFARSLSKVAKDNFPFALFAYLRVLSVKAYYFLRHLEQPGGAHAAADAHRAHHQPRPAPLAFDQRVPDHPRPRHAVGM